MSEAGQRIHGHALGLIARHPVRQMVFWQRPVLMGLVVVLVAQVELAALQAVLEML